MNFKLELLRRFSPPGKVPSVPCMAAKQFGSFSPSMPAAVSPSRALAWLPKHKQSSPGDPHKNTICNSELEGNSFSTLFCSPARVSRCGQECDPVSGITAESMSEMAGLQEPAPKFLTKACHVLSSSSNLCYQWHESQITASCCLT